MLFAFRPTLIYKFGDVKETYQGFFSEFWKKVNVTTSSADGSKKFTYEGLEKGKEAYERFSKLIKEREESSNKNDPKYRALDVVSDMPFLSISKDLLRCFKENLISDLVVISSTRNSKKDEKSMVVLSKEKRFSETFGNFPQSRLNIIIGNYVQFYTPIITFLNALIYKRF